MCDLRPGLAGHHQTAHAAQAHCGGEAPNDPALDLGRMTEKPTGQSVHLDMVYDFKHASVFARGHCLTDKPSRCRPGLGLGCVVRCLFLDGAVSWSLWLHVTEDHDHDHDHEHVHEPMEHEHLHVHDEHHQHEHAADDPPGEPHTHWHRHERLKHRHRHVPDMHHTHRH